MSAEILEDYDWESEDSEDWESEEAFTEAEDSAEDIGERARRRRRQIRYAPARPHVAGVQGMRVRGQGGKNITLPFPAKLATAAETNRVMARQELGRRELAERLDRLEARARALQRKDSSVSGLVTLAIGGGLAGFGAIQAGKKSGNSFFQKWAAEPSTKTASVVSAAQLATSGAKLLVDGRYHRSRIGITADIYSAAQLAAFVFGSLHEPERSSRIAASFQDAQKQVANADIGDVFVTADNGEAYRVVQGVGNARMLRKIV